MSECPYCKKSPAYISFNEVECSNPECDHFCEAMLPEKDKEEKLEDEDREDTKPQYLWVTHHHDFGD